jgi:TusA-related sulfurtransferase
MMSFRRIKPTTLALENLVSNDLLEAKQTDPQFISHEFCEICKAQRLKSFLQSFKKQKFKTSEIDPKRFLLLREFFLESYDKRLFNECKEIWNEVRLFDVLRFLFNFESLKANIRLERDIRKTLKEQFGVESRKSLLKALSTEFGRHTLELKKNLIIGVKAQEKVSDFEEYAQKIFLKEFGIILEVQDL